MYDFAQMSEVLGYDVQASPMEVISPGLSFQWLFDQRVMVFSAEHTNRELVDAWADKIHSVADQWPLEKPFCTLNDFSGPQCATTPYNRQKNTELLRTYRHLTTVTALVVKRDVTMALTQLFIRTALAIRPMQVNMTFDRATAVNWIKSRMDQPVQKVRR